MPITIKEDDLKKGIKYTNETVAQLLETTPKKTGDTEVYLLNHTVNTEDGGADIKSEMLSAPSATTNSNELSAQLIAFEQPNHDNFKVGGVFLSGSGDGNHFIGAVFDSQSNTLTILDPLSPDETRSASYADSITKIEEAFIGKFGEQSSRGKNKGITIKHNPKGRVLHQNDVVSCGPASVYSVQSMLQGQEIRADDEKGIKAENGIFSSEEGAEKLRAYQKQQIEQYNEDNMSKTNGSEPDEEEKERINRVHQTPEDNLDSTDFIGSNKEITNLWQIREYHLKDILAKNQYDMTITVENGTERTAPTADELIHHYNILTDDSDQAKKVRQEIYTDNQKFSTALAEAMLNAVKEGSGQKLDFSSKTFQSNPKITINTGDRDLELPVTINEEGHKEIKIKPDTLKENDNFTMSLAFQDEHGRNMPKNGALYYQIRVENGKITSVSAPEMHQDNPPDGPFHAFAKNGNKVYPKVDIETIKRNLGLQEELAADNAARAPKTPDALSKPTPPPTRPTPTEEEGLPPPPPPKRKENTLESDEGEQARPATAPTAGLNLRQSLQTAPKTPAGDGALRQRGLGIGNNQPSNNKGYTPIHGGFPGVKAVAQNKGNNGHNR